MTRKVAAAGWLLLMAAGPIVSSASASPSAAEPALAPSSEPEPAPAPSEATDAAAAADAGQEAAPAADARRQAGPADAGASDAPARSSPAEPAPAGIVNFSGRVRERGTRAPLPGVLVTVFRAGAADPAAREGFEAMTDADGHFELFDLAPGAWRIHLETPGYFPYRTTERIQAGMAVGVTYFVERGAYNPFDVTVNAEREHKEVNRLVLPAAVIDKVPGTVGDPLLVLQDLPGVARTPLASGLVVVRGAAPEDTQTFVEGATVPQIYHFGGIRSVLPVGILESLDFQPGNFASAYGRATGGIIDVRIKKLEPPRFGGYADLSLLDGALYLEAPVGPKAAVAISARRSYIDLLLKSSSSDDSGVNLVAAPAYYDYQLLANYRPSVAHDLRLLFFGSDDRLSILFTKPGALAAQATSPRFDQHQGFYRGILHYHYVASSAVDNRLTLSAGHDTEDVSLGRVTLNLGTATAQLRDTVRFTMAPTVTAVAGVDLLFQQLDGIARLPPLQQEGAPPTNDDLTHLIETHLNGRRAYSPAAFAELEWRPLPPLLLSVGMRADYFSRISETTVAPRLIARYRVAPRLTLKAGAGLYHQEPQLDETDPSFGNPGLRAERAVHLSIGVEWRPRPLVLVDATFFYKDLSSLVSSTDASSTVDGVTRPLRFDNNGVGRVMGFELLLKHDFNSSLAGWIAYTFSRSERRDSGQAGFRLFDFDQTHILAAVATYQLPRNWQLGARFRFVTGNPDTPVVGAVYNSTTDRFDPTYGAVNSTRIPSFEQLDLRIDKRWIHDRWSATLYVDLQNVTNHVNPEGRSYNFDYTTSAITRSLPVLAIVGWKIEF